MNKSGIISLLRCTVLLGSVAFASIAVAQPSITSIYPDGNLQYQTNRLTFNVSSGVGVDSVTGISVTVNGHSLLTGADTSQVFTSGNGLVLTGSSTSWDVALLLETNMVYGITINATDVNSATTSVSPHPSLYDYNPNYSFDTVVPAYTFEAPDWNYNSGQYIDNPQTNAYLGITTAVPGVDYVFHGGSGSDTYARAGISTEPLRSGDIGRPDRNNKSSPGSEFYFSYDVAPASVGTWANYTRTIPAGTYRIFARVSSVASTASVGKISLVDDATTSTQNVTDLGTFSTRPTGSSWFEWTPVLNSLGAPAQFTATGAPMTLRYTTTSAELNWVEFFMLIPTAPVVQPPAPPVISSVFPDGLLQFQTNRLTFNVSSTRGVNSVTGISVTLNGTSLVTGQTTSQVFTNGNGLVLTGSSTSWDAALPLATNMEYSVTIHAVDTTGTNSASYSVARFDTIVPAYTFEAADWNYNSGQFIDNPQTNAYLGITTAASGVDYVFNGSLGSDSYLRSGISTEGLRHGDVQRADRHNDGNPDGEFYFSYDVAPAAVGTWANYTRTIPAGTYNIFARVSGFSDAANVGKMSLVDNATTSTQNLTDLGNFGTIATGASFFGWKPVLNGVGNVARFTASGAPMTLRYTTTTGDLNYVAFFMLIPTAAAPPVINQPTLTSPKMSGGSMIFSFLSQSAVSYQVQFKANLTDPVWTPVGAFIPGTGLTMTVTNATSGDTGFYRLLAN